MIVDVHRLAATKNIVASYRTHGINKDSTSVIVVLFNASPEDRQNITQQIKGTEVASHDLTTTANKEKILKVCPSIVACSSPTIFLSPSKPVILVSHLLTMASITNSLNLN